MPHEGETAPGRLVGQCPGSSARRAWCKALPQPNHTTAPGHWPCGQCPGDFFCLEADGMAGLVSCRNPADLRSPRRAAGLSRPRRGPATHRTVPEHAC
jgi:hypothetical protein